VITHVALTVLASGESKKSGPIGLAVILILCVACYFLFKSMSKHLRRVREDFPERPAATPPDERPAEQDAPPPASNGAPRTGTPQAPADDAGA
jgi:hypothetical protein